MLALILIPFAFAQYEEDAFPLIEKANESIRMRPNEPPCANCSQLTAVGTDENRDKYSIFKECYPKICPGTEDTIGISSSPADDDTPNKELNERYRPLRKALEDFIESDENRAKMIEEFLAAIRGGKQFDISDQAALNDFVGELEGSMSALAFATLKDKNLSADKVRQITEQALMKNRGLGSELTKKGLLLARDRRLVATGLNDFGAAYKYRFIYPNQNFQEAVRRDLKETLAALRLASKDAKGLVRIMGLDQELRSRSDKLAINSTFVDEIEGKEVQAITDRVLWTIRVSQTLSPDFHLVRTHVARNLKIIKEMVASSKFTEVEREHLDTGVSSLSLEELAHEYHSNNLIWQAKPGGPDLPEHLRPRIRFNKVSKAYAECMLALTESHTNLPDEDSINKFMANIPNLRATMKKSLSGRFSRKTRKLLDKYIDDVQFSPPPAKSNYLKDIIAHLQQRTTSRQRALDIFRREPEKGGILMSVHRGEEGGGGASEQLQKICSRLTYRPVRDNTVAELGAIAIGSHSINNPHFGRGACNHELGHGIFDLLTRNKNISTHSRKVFDAARVCLVNNHKPFFDKIEEINTGRKNGQPHDRRLRDHYVAEDFADAVAGIATPRPNFWCRSQMTGTNLDDDMIRHDEVPDNHSMDTFRIFNIEISSGRRLDASCREFLEKAKNNVSKCL